MLRVVTLICALLLWTGTPVRAELINLGNGMVYDTVQDLTWLQDTHYARTSGADADGWMLKAEAVAWAGNLTFGGFDDWRLPVLTADGPMGFGDPNHSSEITRLLVQLGWDWPDWGDVTIGEVGPFLSFYDTPQPMSPVYWLGNDTTPAIWHVNMAWDWRDESSVNPSGVWAVRSGHPSASVPEPSTLLCVGIGCVVACRFRRRFCLARV